MKLEVLDFRQFGSLAMDFRVRESPALVMTIRAVCPADRDESRLQDGSADRDAFPLQTKCSCTSMVADGAFPPGFELEFSIRGPVIQSAARRHGNRVGRLTKLDASCSLHWHHARKKRQATDIKKTAPRSCTSRLQRSLHTGPTARGDADEKSRSRWVEVLAAVLVHTLTPIGKQLRDKPASIELLGAGRSTSMLRSPMRAVRSSIGLPFHGGSRRSLPAPKRTASQMYSVIQEEVLANTILGRPTKQGPRILLVMLSMLEEVANSVSASMYHGIYGCYVPQER